MKFLELTDKPRPDDGSEPIIKAFVKFTSQKLGLQEPPKIVLHRNPKLASQRRSFGGYMPGQGIEINIGNRHIMDVLRTLAHEMVHYKQDINGELKPDSGRDGSDEENEANAKAAVVMRLWAKMNPELFQHATILAESQKKKLTPKSIHKIADKKGIKWDDEPAFLKLTRRVAGHRYLDDLDQDGLFKMKNYLDRLDEGFFDIVNKSPTAIRGIQTVLQKMGYNLGPTGVDGKIGPYTQSAIDAVTSMKGPRDQIVNKNGTPNQRPVSNQSQPRTRSMGSSSSIKPVNGPITSAFGRRARGQHNGVDFGVPIGTPVKSPVSGSVKGSGYTRGSQGNYVTVIGDNGEVHKFFHLSKVMVRAGSRVTQGQVVGLSGNSGTSTGPHLHWEKHVSGYPTNPIAENFADGKHPEDKGDSARHGIPKKASLSSLDKITHSNASPRKKQLAHWQANMRRGRNKNG
jgi:murein DD-endopeptidase MepM/ murein hydrolase activator NlpD